MSDESINLLVFLILGVIVVAVPITLATKDQQTNTVQAPDCECVCETIIEN